MTKTLTAIAIAAGLAAAGTIYPQTSIITNCDAQKDLVTMDTGTGILYQFYGVEDYSEGDLISCIMFDNFTPDDVRDDVILSVRYAGYTEMFDKITR